MCRVVPPRASRPAPAPAAPAGTAALFEQLQPLPEVKVDESEFAEVDFEGMFDEVGAGLDAGATSRNPGLPAGVPVLHAKLTHAAVPSRADLDLLELMKGVPVPAFPAPAPIAFAAPAPLPIPSFPQQQAQPALQLQAMLPPGIVLPTQSSLQAQLQERYAQALLQQQQGQAQAQAPRPPMPSGHKRAKSAAEAAEQQERIKRRRRESAARSRQRRSCYMHTLEEENAALKEENERLRAQLARATGNLAGPHRGHATTGTLTSSTDVSASAPMPRTHSSSGGYGGLPSLADGLPLPSSDALAELIL